MSDAAQLILQADHTITGGIHYSELFTILSSRGFLGDLKNRISSTQSFTTGTGPIMITLAPDVLSGNIEVFDIAGRLIYRAELPKQRIFFLPNEIFVSSGVYVVSIHTPEERISEKVLFIQN
jgi:hypothetical protein